MSSVIKFSAHTNAPDTSDVYIVEPAVLKMQEPVENEEITEFQPAPAPEEEIEEVPEVDPRDLAQLEAESIIEAGRAEAESIIEAARAEAESIRNQAYEQGMQEGFAAGEAKWLERMEEAAGHADKLNQERDQFFIDIEPQVVKLAVDIAEKIIRRELSASTDIVFDLVKGGLRQLRDKENVKVRVNPADVELIKQRRPDLIEAFDGIRNLEVVDDRRVEQGGCMIDAPGGVLDVRPKTQLKEIERIVMEAAAEHAGSASPGPE